MGRKGKNKMRIRDGYASINGDKTEYELPSGEVSIISDDGRSLFDVRLNEDGSIEISPGPCGKHGGVLLDDVFVIIPKASNRIVLKRPEYKGK